MTMDTYLGVLIDLQLNCKDINRLAHWNGELPKWTKNWGPEVKQEWSNLRSSSPPSWKIVVRFTCLWGIPKSTMIEFIKYRMKPLIKYISHELLFCWSKCFLRIKRRRNKFLTKLLLLKKLPSLKPGILMMTKDWRHLLMKLWIMRRRMMMPMLMIWLMV